METLSTVTLKIGSKIVQVTNFHSLLQKLPDITTFRFINFAICNTTPSFLSTNNYDVKCEKSGEKKKLVQSRSTKNKK